MPDEEWIKTLADGRKVKFIYQELPGDGAVTTVQIASHEIVYSVVRPRAGNPLNREIVEDHFQADLSKQQTQSVRNGTEWTSSLVQDGYMWHKKADKIRQDETCASVKKEMAKPRMARSARIAERKLDTARIPEQPSATMPGTVNKIIPPRLRQPEKAQIAVNRTDHRHRDLRIENSLTDESGDEVKLKKGEIGRASCRERV